MLEDIFEVPEMMPEDVAAKMELLEGQNEALEAIRALANADVKQADQLLAALATAELPAVAKRAATARKILRANPGAPAALDKAKEIMAAFVK